VKPFVLQLAGDNCQSYKILRLRVKNVVNCNMLLCGLADDNQLSGKTHSFLEDEGRFLISLITIFPGFTSS
jgi:hypothetical protein